MPLRIAHMDLEEMRYDRRRLGKGFRQPWGLPN